MSVMTNGKVCCFSSCSEDMGIKTAQGWRELTAEEIAAAGMIGHEHMVAPDNATITDGRINFVQPPDMQIAVDVPPVIISSDTITIPDAELLVAAAKAGDKTAAWLIAKLEL